MARKRRSSQFKDSSQVIDIQEARRKRREKRQKQLKKAEQAKKDAAKPVRASVKARQRNRIILVAVITLVFIAAIGASIFNILSLKAEQKEALKQQEQLQQEKEELQEQLENSDDEEYVKEQAREQLRLVDPGEKIYIVPSVGDNDKEDSESE